MSEFSFPDVLGNSESLQFYEDFLAALKKRKKRIYQFDLSAVDRVSYAPLQTLVMAFRTLDEKNIVYDVEASDVVVRAFEDLGLMSLLPNRGDA